MATLTFLPGFIPPVASKDTHLRQLMRPMIKNCTHQNHASRPSCEPPLRTVRARLTWISRGKMLQSPLAQIRPQPQTQEWHHRNSRRGTQQLRGSEVGSLRANSGFQGQAPLVNRQ